MIKTAILILITITVLAGLLALIVRLITFHPAAEQAEPITCANDAPNLQPGQTLKVLTYNVQYLAGKNHFFWYEGGDDRRATPEEIAETAQKIAQLIRRENPDIILLQELDDGAKRTDYQDQLTLLLHHLPPDYRCYTSAFYWQAVFVPHPSLMGAIGHKLAVVSKYKINAATRYQLPLAPTNPLTRQFSPKRAILETRLPVAGAPDLAVLTTHLEVADRGAAVMQQQVAMVDARLRQLNRAGHPWLIGGDFNLLPPGQRAHLRADQQPFFRPQTELQPLFETYQVIPGPAQTGGDDAPQWFTFFSNNPSLTGPDRTLDYIFFADTLELLNGYARQDALALAASDHLPLVAEFRLP